MNAEMLKFAAEIRQFMEGGGISLSSKQAKQLEAAMMAGYIYGALSQNPAAQHPLLHLLIMSGRQLTTEANRTTTTTDKE